MLVCQFIMEKAVWIQKVTFGLDYLREIVAVFFYIVVRST